MASNQKKNQKFGRHRATDRRCNPSVKRYHSSERWKSNKIKKLRKHLRKQPDDLRAKSALTNLEKGLAGPVATFPYVEPPRPTKLHISDVAEEFRHHHKNKDNKIVLHEEISTKEIFCVESCGITQERGLHYADVFRFYEESHGACNLVARQGAKVRVLKNKNAIPPRGFEGQLRKQVRENIFFS